MAKIADEGGIDFILPIGRWKGYGGGLADYAKISERGATILPQTLSLADGALVEPFAVGRRAVRLANPAPVITEHRKAQSRDMRRQCGLPRMRAAADFVPAADDQQAGGF